MANSHERANFVTGVSSYGALHSYPAAKARQPLLSLIYQNIVWRRCTVRERLVFHCDFGRPSQLLNRHRQGLCVPLGSSLVGPLDEYPCSDWLMQVEVHSVTRGDLSSLSNALCARELRLTTVLFLTTWDR